MVFTSTKIIPEQNRALTPDVFIIDEYGKVADIRKDGQLIVNDAVRMSRIVDKLVPAFSNDDSIIYGMYIKKDSLKVSSDGDLSFSLYPGMALLDSRVIKFEQLINATWIGFASSVPAYLTDGKIVIYLYYKDQIPVAAPEGTIKIENLNQPYRRNEPYYPTKKYPDNQAGLNPVELRYAYVDPITEKFVGQPILKDSHYAIITSSLWFHKDAEGDITVELKEDRTNLVIDGEEFVQQGGGNIVALDLDGGTLDDLLMIENVKTPMGIYELLNIEVNTTEKEFDLIKNPDYSFYVFLNGILVKDYTINNLKIQINQVKPGDRIFVFETIPTNSEIGGLSKIFDESRQIQIFSLVIPGLISDDKLLIWINGKLISESSYSVIQDQINFNPSIPAGSHVVIVKITDSNLIHDGIYQYYRDMATDSDNFFLYQINQRPLFIFYQGKLLLRNIDFVVKNNVIIFKKLKLSSKNELLILGV